MRVYWRTAIFAVVLVLLICGQAEASRTSFYNAHPPGWMHMLPVGESPGWSTPAWVNFDFNHANVWNKQFTMTDRRNGDVYTYAADFEQSSAVLDLGFTLSARTAFSLVVPYANRNGGFLDDFIDQFHQVIGSNRFLRHVSDSFDNKFKVQTNGEDRLTTQHGQGVGNAKTKFKWWLWQYNSISPGACDCGLSVSTEVKFPTQPAKFGLSSGTNDYTGAIHLGLPIGDYSGTWLTAAFTKLGENETFKGWPIREWQQMYEWTLDLAMGRGFGVILQARAESPYLMREHLDFNYTYPDNKPDGQKGERIASGWNSLVYWRGSQTLGFRWLFDEGSTMNFMLMEDWGIGNKDGRKDWLYVNNAPDVAFITQWHFTF